jgi:hypothetical protein
LDAQRGVRHRSSEPYLYELAGIQAEIDPAAQAAADAALGRKSGAQSAFSAAEQELADARTARAALKGAGKYEGKRQDRKAAKKRLRVAKRGRRASVRDLDAAATAADAAVAEAGRITKLTPTGKLGSAEDQRIDELLTGRVTRALETGASEDPRLNRELGEEEARVREQLRRAYGSDYENTTAGNMALANFRQRRSESLADFARRDVTEYEPMRLNQRRTLGDIAGIMQGLALRLVSTGLGMAGAYGALAKDNRGFLDYLQRDRTAMWEANATATAANNAQDAAADARLQGAIGKIADTASGIGGIYASGAMTSRPPADMTYPDAPGVSIGARWGDRVGSMFGSGQSLYTAGF